MAGLAALRHVAPGVERVQATSEVLRAGGRAAG